MGEIMTLTINSKGLQLSSEIAVVTVFQARSGRVAVRMFHADRGAYTREITDEEIDGMVKFLTGAGRVKR